MKILDLGCGQNKVPGAIGLDNIQLPGVDIVHDLMNFPYPIKSVSMDKIYLRHVIEHFEIETINSILNQTFKNWNLIIIDDNSNSETKKILKSYDNHQKINIIWLKKPEVFYR